MSYHDQVGSVLKLHIRSILFLSLLGPIANASETFFTLSEQVKNVYPSVVKIKVQRSESTDEETELITFDSGGSGFVFDADHHIVTNTHVIRDAKKIVIIDENSTEYPANMVGKDEKSDIAVLEAATFPTPSVTFGTTTHLSPGDGVFVIGSPFSLGYSVSAGIISAMQRFLPNYPYLHFIQTDSAINPGNSGGAMFNMNGEVVGMASTHFTRQGGYTNIGFAIPIEEVKRIAQQLITNRKIERGYLGAELLISERISRKMGYPFSVLITRIDPGSPAENCGLQSGDIIVALNTKALHDNGELHRYLEQSQPGEQIAITYIRNRQTQSANTYLSTEPDKKREITNVSTADAAEKLGLILRETPKGVEVIMSYATAKMIGIDPLDTLVAVNGTNLKNIKELNALLGTIRENDIGFITIKRNGVSLTLPIGNKTSIKGYSTEN